MNSAQALRQPQGSSHPMIPKEQTPADPFF